jgi:hypothetical protein
MELAIETKIGLIEFSYDEMNDEIIAYTDEGNNDWTPAEAFPSFADYVTDHELNLRLTDHWDYGSESHYTTLSYDSMSEYLGNASMDFKHYLVMNLKKMHLIE